MIDLRLTIVYLPFADMVGYMVEMRMSSPSNGYEMRCTDLIGFIEADDVHYGT
jgi:hypothetical protein